MNQATLNTRLWTDASQQVSVDDRKGAGGLYRVKHSLKQSDGMKAAVGFWGFCGLLFYEGFLSEMKCSQVSDAILTL